MVLIVVVVVDVDSSIYCAKSTEVSSASSGLDLTRLAVSSMYYYGGRGLKLHRTKPLAFSYVLFFFIKYYSTPYVFI